VRTSTSRTTRVSPSSSHRHPTANPLLHPAADARTAHPDGRRSPSRNPPLRRDISVSCRARSIEIAPRSLGKGGSPAPAPSPTPPISRRRSTPTPTPTNKEKADQQTHRVTDSVTPPPRDAGARRARIRLAPDVRLTIVIPHPLPPAPDAHTGPAHLQRAVHRPTPRSACANPIQSTPAPRHRPRISWAIQILGNGQRDRRIRPRSHLPRIAPPSRPTRGEEEEEKKD
jgi:hypothetical protein